MFSEKEVEERTCRKCGYMDCSCVDDPAPPIQGAQVFSPPKGSFQHDLESLINKHSIEGGSNTPDFILAEYLRQCLDAFDLVVRRRDQWYG